MRQLRAELQEDFQILPRRMEDLEHVRVAHQVEEGLQVQALGQRIDHRLDPRRRRLDQAQLRPIGGLAHEFGVDGDERLRRHLLAQRL